jgi:hypothetical protein
LMKSHATVANKNVINLLEVEINMVMMVSVLSFVFFTFLSLFIGTTSILLSKI